MREELEGLGASSWQSGVDMAFASALQGEGQGGWRCWADRIPWGLPGASQRQGQNGVTVQALG